VADPLITARPFATVVPVGYAAGTPTPLVVLLHGYTATAATQDAYFHLSELAQQRTFLLALPDGTVDSTASTSGTRPTRAAPSAIRPWTTSPTSPR
jgi:poly(3-hydroxybutyrate) depolymerase